MGAINDQIAAANCGAEHGEGFGVMTSGLPMGDERYVQHQLRRKVDTVCEGIQTITSSLRSVSNQALYAMLVYCCYPQMTYEMRTLNPNIVRRHLERVDETLLDAAIVATGVDFRNDEFAMRRLRLPRHYWGGGRCDRSSKCHPLLM